jgi:hypothetical protein
MDNRTTYVKEELKALTLLEMQAVSDKTGVPLNTLKRIRYQNVDPRESTITPLFNFFKPNN